MTNCTLFSNHGSNDKWTPWTLLPTGNRDQDIEQSFGLKRGEGFKSSGLLDLSKTNFMSQKAEEEITRKEEIKKDRQKEKEEKQRQRAQGNADLCFV